MANEEHLNILARGVGIWNQWRHDYPLVNPDLSQASITKGVFRRIDFRDADLSGTDLSDSYLMEAEFCHSNLTKAKLCRTNLFRADFFNANLTEANLTESNLEYSVLVETDVDRAIIESCRIYGISAWNLKNRPQVSSNLIIKCSNGSTITVDNLQTAQLIYLMFDNKKIRDVIDSMASRVVLILGRFTPERKRVLNAIRKELRNHNYLPVLFDFEKPDSQDFIEPVTTLAHLSKYIIADVTDAKIVLEELTQIVRNITVPVVPLLMEGTGPEPTTLDNLRKGRTTVLNTFYYRDCNDLIIRLDKVIDMAEAKVNLL